MSARHREPRWAEGLLLKPYYWRRPVQLLRRVGLPLRSIGQTPSVGLPWGVTLDCIAESHVGRQLLRAAVFEIATTELVTRLVEPGDLVIDAGANVGYLSSLMAVAAGPMGKVIAYEPNPEVFGLLERNAARWPNERLSAPIDARCLALSDRAGLAEFGIPVADAERGSLGWSLESDAREQLRWRTVQTVTLDEQVRGVAEVGLVKLDVEGHEATVLAGATSLLERQALRDVLFEDFGVYPTAATDVLESFGYEVLDFAPAPLGVRLSSARLRREIVSWNSPMRVATRDLVRLRRRLARRGWLSLRSPACWAAARRRTF